MTDWPKIEEVGSELQAYWLEMHRKAREGLPAKLAAQRERLDELDPLGAAIRRQQAGEAGAVAKYVSTYRLSDDDQLQLAKFLDGKLAPQRRSKGQPKSNALGAAQVAERFFNEWRDWNGRRGISDHGHRSKMREEAVRFICEKFVSRIYGVSGEEQREKVLANMSRTHARRGIRQ